MIKPLYKHIMPDPCVVRQALRIMDPKSAVMIPEAQVIVRRSRTIVRSGWFMLSRTLMMMPVPIIIGVYRRMMMRT